ncbi:MAG: GNAT family N-acetyltransferase [Thiotrichales bacterium]
MIERARAETALKRVLLHAQIHAVAFYVRHGFEMEGNEYIEAGIPHRTMVRNLSR